MGAIIYFNFSVYFATNYKNICHHVCSFSNHAVESGGATRPELAG